jgi:RNA polymerase sigma factor (sigma-70 family)
VISRDEHRRLLAALDRLPDAYSDVLRQRVLRGRTAAEVGALTGQTANAVRQLQFRAMTALRRELADEQNGEHR